MRSLATKLTLAFLLVGLSGALLVAVILQQRTRTAFNQFVLAREEQSLAASLATYYLVYGGWSGVADRLADEVQKPEGLNTLPGGGREDPRPNYRRLLLIGLDREIIFSLERDQIGEHASSREISRSVAIQVNGNTIGWLVLELANRSWISGSAEGLFLTNVNAAAALSALFAAGLALLLGGVLARTMTGSLGELMEATEDIARGNLGRQVQVHSKDELGELSLSFNKMSLDLEKATQARRQMTADIAHDLRTPLSVLMGYAEALNDGKLPGNPEVYTVLYQETQHLSRLVEDLRTLSLADAGELYLNQVPVDPHELLDRAAARFTVTAQQKDITLVVDTGAGLPRIWIDPERFSQVLDNLITNALRYSPKGSEIVLSAHAGDAMNEVQIRVKDQGEGIRPEDLPHIFNRFFRADQSRRDSGESGLGLAIARSIVTIHHGTISVESTPGDGATFTITLPAASSNA